MPNILYGLAGAGQGFRGAREAEAERQKLEANELALERTRRTMAEEDAERQRKDGFRKGMSQAIGAISRLQSLSDRMPDTPTISPKAVGEAAQMGFAKGGPLGAATGAAQRVGQYIKGMKDIEGWIKGKDDATAKALAQVTEIAQRLAQDDPEAAQYVIESARSKLQPRVLGVAVQSFTKRGANLIQRLGKLVQDGRISESLAPEIQDRIQQAMELAESDPNQLGVAEQAYNTALDAIDKDMERQDNEATALAELEWYVEKPGGYNKKLLDKAKRLLEQGMEPSKVLAFVRSGETEWAGGYLEDAPEAKINQWKAEAWQKALDFVAEKMPEFNKIKDTPEAFMARIFEQAQLFMPQFEETIQRMNGVVNPGQKVTYGRGGEPGMTAADYRFIQERMRSMQPPAAATGQVPGGQPQAGPQPSPMMGASNPPHQVGSVSPQGDIMSNFSTQKPAGQQGSLPPIDPSALNAALAQGKPQEGTDKDKRLKRLKIKKGEDPRKFMQRVVEEVTKVGGSREDVIAVMEANGVKPQDLKPVTPAPMREPSQLYH